MNPDEAKRILMAFLRVKNLAVQTQGLGKWYGSISEYWLKNLAKSNKDKWDLYWKKLKEDQQVLLGIQHYNEIFYGGACNGCTY